MKQPDELQPTPLERPLPQPKSRRSAKIGHADHLLQVHPIPRSRPAVLRVALHFVHRFAAIEGKVPPALSEDAAVYLVQRRWVVTDLACRLGRAVATNRGSLITAADLSSS